MTFYHGILNLTGWAGNVDLANARCFIHCHRHYSVFEGNSLPASRCTAASCVSWPQGCCAPLRRFASQRSWNDADLCSRWRL